MFEQLDATRSLTANQRRIVLADILGDMLEVADAQGSGVSKCCDALGGFAD
jgi:hypothetical protein